MRAASPYHETEIKLPLAAAADGRRLLRRAGFRVSKRKLFESNTLFDTPEAKLRTAGSALRVRECDGRAILTFKGPVLKSRHKTREELELDVSDGALFVSILSRLGFAPAFRYEKYRTEFKQIRRGGVAMLDETPIGTYLELEGEPDWIDVAAKRLGFTAANYITTSYVGLYSQFREQNPQSPRDMVFPDKKAR
jgi:adenylate cyclase class 2